MDFPATKIYVRYAILFHTISYTISNILFQITSFKFLDRKATNFFLLFFSLSVPTVFSRQNESANIAVTEAYKKQN